MLQARHKTQRNNWLTDIIILTTLFAVFYLLWLGSYPLFTPDEGRYSEVAREMIASGDYVTPRVNGVAFLDKPVLYYWLQAIAIHLFGIKEWALRFFPVLTAILGCIVTYVCGRYLFNRRTGQLSAIILATSPLYFGSAHYANLDLEVAVFISCALLFFLTAIQTEATQRSYFLFAAYFFAGLAFLTKGLIGIVFPIAIVGSWIVLLWRWDVLKKAHLIAGCALMALIILPWYILAQKANPEFLHYFFVTQQVTRFLSGGEFNNKTPFWFYVPIVLIGFFPWTIFMVQALYKHIRAICNARHQYQTELFLVLWFAIVFIFFSIPHSKTISYILPTFAPLALLVGHYLSNTWEQTTHRLAVTLFIICGALLATLLFALPRIDLIDMTPGFLPYIKAIAIIISISAFVSLLFFRKTRLLPLFATCVICNVVFLLTLTLGAGQLNQNSAKPLVISLKSVIKPHDEVIHYYKFYQDVPLYLERRVTIVADWDSPNIPYRDNWQRELWYGMPFQKTDDWLIKEKEFWLRWRGSNRVFVFLNKNYFNQFKSHARHYYILGTHNDIILLSNKPNIL